jgi:hypothetical protein
MKRLITIISLLSILGLTLPVSAQDKVGTSAAPFIGIGIGPAATAMGGAYASFARDAYSLYWNPGAISRVEHSVASFTHTGWILGSNYNWGGLILNLGEGNALGVQFAYLDYGEENVTTVQAPEGTGDRWSASDLFAALSFARNFTDRFSVGGSAKIIREKIYNSSATGYAIDLGLLYITDFNGMRLGMSIQNFGTDMQMDGQDLWFPYDQNPNINGNNYTITGKWKTDSWPLPLFFRLGLSMDVFSMAGNTITLATDAFVPSDNSTVVNVGAEYNFDQIFFLRGGYQSLGRAQTQEGLTAGLGLQYQIPGFARVTVDYSFLDFGILGDFHTFGFGFTY